MQLVLILLLLLLGGGAASAQNPPTTQSFSRDIVGMRVVQNHYFGTGPQATVTSLPELTALFNPYGIAGTTPINQEWQRYQTFNPQNFVFTPHSLDLTAYLPSNGGLWDGGISSAQIATKQTFRPGVGATVYAFEVRARIPNGPGAWPAAWFYTQSGAPGMNDGSEIDNPEFFVSQWQNEYDWTGFQHGPGVGATVYDIKSNPWVWHPGTDFSASYHDYQTYWTGDTVYKYVDGRLIFAQRFRWTALGAAQLIVNLAVGSPILPLFVPTSADQLPKVLSVDHITIWAK